MAKSKGQILFGEALRSSGLPLEYVVAGILPKIGRVLPKGRYFYQMNSKECETDLWALGGWTHESYAVEHIWFIECKHRTAEKKWCFFPQTPNVVDLSNNAFFLDLLEGDKKIRSMRHSQISRDFLPQIPVLGDGTELFINSKGNWEANSECIPNAIRQAVSPFGTYVRNVLINNFVMTSPLQWIELLLPIVVTTAKIHILKEGTDWGTLSAFNRMEDCFEPAPAIYSVFSTPQYVSDYWRGCIVEAVIQLSEEVPRMIERSQFLSSLGDTSNEIGERVGRMVIENRPTRVLVVELDSLQKVMGDYMGQVDAMMKDLLARYG